LIALKWLDAGTPHQRASVHHTAVLV